MGALALVLIDGGSSIYGGDMQQEPASEPARPAPDNTVLFFGKTGAGKTTLINALFGLRLYTDNTQAATRALQRVPVELVYGSADTAISLTVVDVPGFAESQAADDRHRELYADTVPLANHIVWAIQAHPRVFKPDQLALLSLRGLIPTTTRLTVAMTHVDTIGPNDWDKSENRPSPDQAKSIAEQVDNILRKLSAIYPLTADDVFPCSPTKVYGIDEIRQRVAGLLGGCGQHEICQGAI
jgi:predicted GTPase